VSVVSAGRNPMPGFLGAHRRVGTTSQRSYGVAHQRERARWKPIVDAAAHGAANLPACAAAGGIHPAYRGHSGTPTTAPRTRVLVIRSVTSVTVRDAAHSSATAGNEPARTAGRRPARPTVAGSPQGTGIEALRKDPRRRRSITCPLRPHPTNEWPVLGIAPRRATDQRCSSLTPGRVTTDR
jgi:hypothetical protein